MKKLYSVAMLFALLLTHILCLASCGGGAPDQSLDFTLSPLDKPSFVYDSESNVTEAYIRLNITNNSDKMIHGMTLLATFCDEAEVKVETRYCHVGVTLSPGESDSVCFVFGGSDRHEMNAINGEVAYVSFSVHSLSLYNEDSPEAALFGFMKTAFFVLTLLMLAPLILQAAALIKTKGKKRVLALSLHLFVFILFLSFYLFFLL